MVHALRERGHDVFVLTSKHGLGYKYIHNGVYRVLDARPDVSLSTRNTMSLLRMFSTEYINHRSLRQVIKKVRPDIILVMHVHSLLKSLLIKLEQAGKPLVYDISDPGMLTYPNSGDNWNKWFDWWEGKPATSVKKYGKSFLRKIVSATVPTFPEHILLNKSYFTSQAIKQSYLDSGFRVENSPVLAPGICLKDFPFVKRNPHKDTIVLLYAGRIAPEKGIETAVEALPLLKEGTTRNIRLSLAGPCDDPTYLAKLENVIRQLSLKKEVAFISPRPLEQMPDLYQTHDIFIFPAVWEEPFGRAWIEALASGLPLITTATGGAKDYLCHEKNCLIFAPKKTEALANSVLRILQDVSLFNRVTKNGRELVEKHFFFSEFIDNLESYLEQTVDNYHSSPQ